MTWVVDTCVVIDGGNVIWATDMEGDALHERRGRRRFVLKASQSWERKGKAGKWRIVFHAHDSSARVHPRQIYVADVSFVRDAAGQPTLAIGGELITCRPRGIR